MLPKVENENLRYSYEKVSMDIVLDSDSTLPEYKTIGSAGMDLVASKDTTLVAFKPEAVSTGIKISIPKGYVGTVCPRSGLSLKGVTVYNAPGVVDEDFTGEVKVILMYIPTVAVNSRYEISKGERIAQLIVSKYERISLNPVLFLMETSRGANGFGSTGV